MKFAFSSNGFLRHSLKDTIRILADIGYQGIEIMADVPHAYPTQLSAAGREEIRAALREHRMEISNVNAFMHHADGDTYHPSWIEKDAGERKRRVEYTLNCIDLAQDLGARTISTEPGGPLDGITREEGFQFFREGLAAVEERARKKRVRILIEPEPGLLIENSRQFLELYRLLDPEVFGLNFDIGHFFCVGEDPQALIPKMKGTIGHFHLEDIAASRIHHHLMPGEGAIDLPAVLEAVRGIAFEGYVTVELYTYVDNAVEAARDAFRYLRRVIS